MSTPTLGSLLDEIVDAGERLCTAIANRELSTVHDCLAERSDLLARLEKISDELTVEDHPQWEAINEQLRQQHERIREGFEEYRDDIEDELQQLNGYREARSAYTTPDDGSRQILHKNVEG